MAPDPAGSHPEIADAAPVELSLSTPIWDRFFTVAPLTIVGTIEPDGGHDLAPKHMATPLGRANRFCFVCRPSHATQRNAEASGQFTVSFPTPEQLIEASLAAGPRSATGSKPSLEPLAVHPATQVEGVLLDGAYLWLECELERVVEGFDEDTLIAGRIVAASVDEAFLRASESDDAELLETSPLLAYVSPGRVAAIRETYSFPYPADFRR